MNIELRRIRTLPETIDGQIYIDGIKVCDCAESASGAVPEGTYELTLRKCKQYGRKMIMLNPGPPCGKCPKMEFCCNNSTLPCYCPQIKPGNGVFKRLDGSIIVGKHIVPGCLSHPKQAFDALYDRIRKNIERKNQVYLIISSL